MAGARVRRHPSGVSVSMRQRLMVAAALLCVAGAARAQAPARPELPRGADANDWQAYYDFGVKVFRDRPSTAEAAFYWASRLAPNRAEPLLGRWAGYWYRWDGRFQQYLNDEIKGGDELKEVQRVDSIRYRAMLRNPFAQRFLIVLAIEHLPGEWAGDLATRASLASAQGDYRAAAALLADAIRREPQKSWYHEERALAFTALGRLDSAAAETEALLAAERRQESGHMVHIYQSKAVMEYGLGMLYFAQHQNGPAREAFSRALTEDFSFAPAHAMMGEVALAESDTATAFREYRQAVELAPDDGSLRVDFGRALVNAGAAQEAVPHLRRAVELEPDYADAYVVLGSALDTTGDREGAIAAYREYLRRAPKRDASRIAAVEARVGQLVGGSS
jgi:Tfp pilus assembly protein PilF